jgi:hypothetical protein
MTAAPGVWPSSRHLLGWWRELADLGPRRLWVCRLGVHRVEALAAVGRREPLDPLGRALLRFLSLFPLSKPGDAPWSRLLVDGPLLDRLLRGFAARGLVEAPPGGWVLTAAGHKALGSGAILQTSHERRLFAFLDRSEARQPPHFLPLAPAAGAAAPADGWAFDPAVLEACVRQPEAWKARWGFPADVEAILFPAGREDTDPPDWQRVVLDRPEEVTALLVEGSAPPKGGAGGPLIAFPVQPPAWALRREAPLLELGEGWEEALGDLMLPPSGEEWKQAWQAWCQPRGLPAAEVDACGLEPGAEVLRVRAPHRLVERLRAARSDAVKNEAWLLAGAGRARIAAHIELVDA